jgi:hypothetical protein
MHCRRIIALLVDSRLSHQQETEEKDDPRKPNHRAMPDLVAALRARDNQFNRSQQRVDESAKAA